MRHALERFGPVLMPDEAMEPILAKPVRAALLEWLEEIWAKDDLADVGLKARMRAIFTGPPGTGKTTLAHHLAARLGLPLLIVRPEKINCRYMNASAEAVGQLFDMVAAQPEPVFLFFDEFDSVAAKRMGTGVNEAIEQDHNVTINTLLAAMDRFDGFIVAATNLGSRVDEAVWRRFEIQIEIALPGEYERQRIVERYLAPFVLPKPALTALSAALETASPALIRSFCEHIKRQVVVGPKAGWMMTRTAVIDRVLTTVKPHPDLGLPRLWSVGSDDKALSQMPWPLQRDVALYPDREVSATAQDSGAVVAFRRGGDRQ